MQLRSRTIALLWAGSMAAGCSADSTSSMAEESDEHDVLAQHGATAQSPVEVVTVKPRGTGCRPGTFEVKTSPNPSGETSISVFFTSLKLETADEAPRNLETECVLSFTLKAKPGVSFALLNAQFLGSATLSDEVRASVTTNIGFLPAGLDPSREQRSDFVGPIGDIGQPKGDVNHIHPVPSSGQQPQWMPCGVARTLDVSVLLRLDAPTHWDGITSFVKIWEQRTHLDAKSGVALRFGSKNCT